MNLLHRSLGGLFLVVLTVGLLGTAALMVVGALTDRWSDNGHTAPNRERIFAVEVGTLQAVTATPRIFTFGEVKSRRTLEIRVQSGGTIVELSDHFVDGGVITQGDVLLRTNPDAAQSDLDVALTDQSEASADLQDATEAVDLAIEEVAAAQTQLDLRKAALDRQRDLLTRAVGTEAAVETAALAASAAEQSLLGKRQALAQARARVATAGSNVSRTNIGLAEAERRLNDTVIVAPFDGVLSGVSVLLGMQVTANEKIGSLIDPDALEVSFLVSNAEFSRLVSDASGLRDIPVAVRLDPSEIAVAATGTLDRVSGAVEEGQTGRLLYAKVSLRGQAKLLPGDFVAVEIEEPPLLGVVVVPAGAVDPTGQVLVLGDSDRLEIAQVTVLRKQGKITIVRSDDLLGREVVLRRSPQLGAGIRIKPIRPNADADDDSALIDLTDEHRARLIGFVEGNERIPAAQKSDFLNALAKPRVPAALVKQIEARMQG